MTTIPASSLLPGDRVVRCESQPDLVGWTAHSCEDARTEGDFGEDGEWDFSAFALLSLERENAGYMRIMKTRTAYLKADAMLTVERSSE